MRPFLSTLSALVAASIVSSAFSTARADFSFSFGFGQPAEMVLNGDTFYDEFASRSMVLTNDSGQGSSMWYNTPQSVSNGFTTTFVFQIGQGPTTQIPGDGFAFVLHNDPAGTAALGGAGSGLGYANGFDGATFIPGLTNSLAIEFDTFSFNGDGPQIAIHSRGSASNSAEEADALASVLLSSVTSIDILDGNRHTCSIDYRPAQGATFATITIYIDNTLVLFAPIDLVNINGEDITGVTGEMFVGFTGSTGAADSVQTIPDWGFADNTGNCRSPYWHVMGWGGCGLGCFHEMSIQVVGSGPMQYAWFFNGAEILDDAGGHYIGLGTNVLRVDAPTHEDNGYYKVVFSNACGSAEGLEAFMGTCPGDLDDGTGSGTSDGGVDVSDLIYFLTQFEIGSTEADISWQYGGAIRDASVDINDLLFFLTSFEVGC